MCYGITEWRQQRLISVAWYAHTHTKMKKKEEEATTSPRTL